ncbi:hypothetical protein [Bacillus infantis]|nr:hypothetical protein [Bacillus infantis]
MNEWIDYYKALTSTVNLALNSLRIRNEWKNKKSPSQQQQKRKKDSKKKA